MPKKSELTEEQLLEAEKKEEKKKQEEKEMAGRTEDEKKKSELAKKYGIRLEDIEHVKLDNGKEFFKLVDPKDQSVVMYENIRYNNSLVEQYSSIQQELSAAQGMDERGNAREVHKKEAKDRLEVNLIPIQEFKSNRFKYLPLLQRRISSVDEGKIKAILALEQNSRVLNIKYINIENAFGIDERNNVITADFDYANNRAHIKNAETLVYDKENVDVEKVELEVTISDEEFDKLIAGFDFDDENIVANDGDNLTIADETVSVEQVKTMYNMPESIDKIATSKKQAMIYHGIVSALNRKLAQKKKTPTNAKKKVLTKNTKPASPAA